MQNRSPQNDAGSERVTPAQDALGTALSAGISRLMTHPLLSGSSGPAGDNSSGAGDSAMSYAVYYTTQSGQNTFRFVFEEERDRWQAYVVDGPEFPARLVKAGTCPPGCEDSNGRYRVRWFGLARVASLGQAQALAASWAEDIERFLGSGKWLIPYRTNDGQDTFEFSVEKTGGDLRIYIVRQPDYNGRARDCHTTHRLSDGRRKYICWAGRLRAWGDAEDVASLWSERTQRYIRTGKRFEEND